LDFFFSCFSRYSRFDSQEQYYAIDRYPPQNVKVIRDVRVHHGVAARRIGRLKQAYCVVAVLLLVFLIVAAWFLIQNVDRIVS